MSFWGNKLACNLLEREILVINSKQPLSFFVTCLSLLLVACGSSDVTLKEKLLLIETPIETCPNISGSYEYIGTPLAGMPHEWGGINKNLPLNLLLWLDRLPKNRTEIKEVEIIQTEKIYAIFKGDFGKESLIVHENPQDNIGCRNGKIIQVRMRDAYGEAVSGKSIIKNTYFKTVDGSLNIIVEVVSHLRSFLFFYSAEKIYGAKFAPVKE